MVNRFRNLWWAYACLTWENVANQQDKRIIIAQHLSLRRVRILKD